MIRRPSYTKEDFAWATWGPTDIDTGVKKALAQKRDAYTIIKNIPKDARTFENTIVALDAANDGINPVVYQIKVLLDTSPHDEVRDAAKAAFDHFQQEIVIIEFDEDVYRAVKEYADKQEKLEGPDKKLFDETMREYRRMGFDLPKAERDKLKENIQKLGELSIQFSKNINDWQDSIEVSRDELAGLPDAYIDGLKKTADGKYIVTLQYPDYNPFMDNAVSETRRRELAEKYLQKGGQANIELLGQILNIRRENAKILGYATHADYKTETRTAKTAAAVRDFLDDLAWKLQKHADKDIAALRDLKKEMTGDTSAELAYHDIRYYINQHKKRTCNIDAEALREYFPFSKVKEGIFAIYSKLLSVQFEKIDGYPLWHQDVELFAIKNLDGSLVAYIAFDMHPRPNKYGHACVADIINGWQKSADEYVTPFLTMIANFQKPTADRPALLSHDEVETFFHEFGHLMQGALTTARYMAQAGNSVAWDFVEAPSQMLEHWVWDKEMIKMLSGHWKDGSPMPDEMIDNLIKTNRHMTGHFYMRQLIFGLFDLKIHTEDVEDVCAEFNHIHKAHMGIEAPKDNIFPAGFGHLMGYDAGYYGYLWSKVFADDMFTRFEKEGMLNPKTGGDYRAWILEKGSSIEELDLVRGFLGREPNNEAFLKEVGL